MTELTDPRYVVPPLPAGAGGGVDRLRRAVARFSGGPEHAVRRAAEGRWLATVPPDALRAAARSAAAAALTGPGPLPARGGLVGVVPGVPVAVLAAALGVAEPGAVAELVPVVAAAYFPGGGDTAPADAAVELLLDRHGLDLARIGLLVQACAPVAALVTAAWPVLLARAGGRSHAPDRLARDGGAGPAGEVDAAMAAALAGAAPPVAATRRVDPETGATVMVPLAGIPFGAGERRCPGERHALALAAGVLDALVAAEPTPPGGPRDARALPGGRR